VDETPHEADVAGYGFRSIRTPLRWTTGIPAVLLLLMCIGAAWVVVWPRLELYVIGSGVRTVSIPSVPALASLQTERQLAMAYLARPANGTRSLVEQQHRTDTGLRAMEAAASSALSGAPAEITDRLGTFTGELGQLDRERARIQARTVNATQVYTFYDNLLDAATGLFDAQARVVPDAGITQSAIAAVALFRDADDMSRAGSLVGSALAAGTLTPANYLEFHRLVGYYHTDLATTAQYVQPDVRAEYQGIVAGSAFRGLTNAENAMLERGPRHPDPQNTTDFAPPPRFPVGPGQWTDLTTAVSTQLVDLTIRQANDIATEAADVGRDRFLTGLAILIAMILATVGAGLATFRLSRRLAGRLRHVALGASDLAGRQAPDIVARMAEGEDVDLAAEVPLLDEEPDEIGLLARQIKDAWTADLTARKREILSRKGLTQVLVALARRMQGPVTRLVKILDEAQSQETDPGLLDVLYSLDHEATRAGRQVDNVVVLAGESLARRWTLPVPLIDVVRRAASETSDYRRFVYGQFPEHTSVPPDAAPHLAHMISELLDNAAINSRADSMVNVRAMLTGRGVAVEVEDMGRGMTADEFDLLNARMADPPEFDTMAPEVATRRLGTFVVARLAAKLGVHVAYRESAYQGVLAVVVIPTTLLATPEEPADEPAAGPWVAPPARPWPHDDEDTDAATVTVLLPPLAMHGDLADEQPSEGRHASPPPDPPLRAPLPKRQRGASLAVGLRPEPEPTAAPSSPDAEEPDPASLSVMRDQLRRFKSGTDAGRVAAQTESR
jgi:anti-sigma regulatory factor (Ser/Thr protein kinase)